MFDHGNVDDVMSSDIISESKKGHVNKFDYIETECLKG